MVLFGAAAVPVVVVDQFPAGSTAVNAGLELVGGLFGLIASFLYYGYCEEVADQARRGEVSIRRALGQTARVLPALFVGSVVAAFGIIIGLVLLIVPGIWLLTRWATFSAVISIDRTGPLRALRRSNSLVRGDGLLVLTTATAVIVAEALFSDLTDAFGSAVAPDEKIGALIGETLGDLVTGPFVGLVVVSVFFRLRTRAGNQAAAEA